MTAPSPRAMAVAYRIWAYATPKGWDCSARDIAYALDEPINRIISVCHHRDWSTRLRKMSAMDRATTLVDLGQDYLPKPDLSNVSMWIE